MKKLFKRILITLLLVSEAYAQTAVEYSDDGLRIVYAEFNVNSLKPVSANELFYGILGLNADHTLDIFDSSAITSNLYNYSYMQYYKGIEVEGSSMRLHFQDGKLKRFIGYYLPITDFDTTCSVSQSKAEAAAETFFRQRYGYDMSIKLEFYSARYFIMNPDSNRTLETLPLLCYKIAPVGFENLMI